MSTPDTGTQGGGEQRTGLRLLDAEVSGDYLAEQAERYAQRKAVRRPGAHSILIFRIASEWFALPTSVFSEIAPLRPVHSLPHRGPIVAGLTNVRGELRVCVSLARALGLPTEAGQGASARLAVVARGGDSFVFLTDEVAGLHRYDDADLVPVPGTLVHSRATYTRAMLNWRSVAVGVLDAELLFYALNRSLA